MLVMLAFTVTVASAASMALSTGVRVSTAVALRRPVGIVRVASAASTVPVTAFTLSVTTVSADSGAPSSMPVTVRRFAPPFSDTLSGVTVSVTIVEGRSSSVIVSVCGGGCMIPWAFSAAPDTSTRLLGAVNSLFTPESVTLPVLTVWPAGIVSRVPLSRKSPATAGFCAVAVTVTTV